MLSLQWAAWILTLRQIGCPIWFSDGLGLDQGIRIGPDTLVWKPLGGLMRTVPAFFQQRVADMGVNKPPSAAQAKRRRKGFTLGHW